MSSENEVTQSENQTANAEVSRVTPTGVLPCPLCGRVSGITRLSHPGSKATYNVSCGDENDYTDTCGLVLFGGNGDTRKSMIAKWNQRAKA